MRAKNRVESGYQTSEKPRDVQQFLVRVDDFPRVEMDLDTFMGFDSIMKKFDMPYLLGITPYLCLEPLNPHSQKYRKLDEEEIKVLHELKNVDFAMHGVTHQTREYNFWDRLRGFHSEFVGLSNQELEMELKEGFSLFREYGLPKPKFIIPPFNTFSLNNYELFKEFFKKVLGGPESPRQLLTYSYSNDESFIPSLPPHYGHAKDMRISSDLGVATCFTFHWGWEVEDGFQALKELLVKLKGKVTNWSRLE